MRKMTFKRRSIYAILQPVIKLFLYSIWLSCRVKTVKGDDIATDLINKDEPVIPCYWHQMQIYGLWYMRKLARRGLKAGFLISPSVDGEIPAKIIESWGMTSIRGSSTRTGAKALRDIYNTIVKDRISPVITSDGPKGPIHHFKLGAVTLSQLTQAPIVPIAYAASRCWQLKSWDQFIVPKPFSTIAIVVGKPFYVEKSTNNEELENIRLNIEDEMMHCTARAREILN